MSRRAALPALALIATLAGAARAAQARSDALTAIGTAGTTIGVLSSVTGFVISGRRGERVTDNQLFGGYLVSATSLALGIWASADSSMGSTGTRIGVAVPAFLVFGATLPLTLYHHRKRPSPDKATAAPWGEIVDGMMRNGGLIIASLAFVGNGESPAWLVATAVGGFGLYLDIRRAMQLSEPPQTRVSVSPQIFPTVSGSLAFGASLRVVHW